MTVLTKKYRAALDISKKEHIPAMGDSVSLYKSLADEQYFWYADEGEWKRVSPAEADAASTVLRIRVWADKKIVEDLARDMANMLEAAGFDLQDKSELYVCRPPKQLDGRVYLTFALQEK